MIKPKQIEKLESGLAVRETNTFVQLIEQEARNFRFALEGG